MVDFSSFYASFRGPKITILPICLDFSIYPWIEALHVSFLFLFLKVFQSFPFHRRCFSQTIQVSAEVKENRFLLKARRETIWRFSCLDGDFTHWALFPESCKVGHLSFFTIFLLAEVPLIFLSWTSWFSPSNSKVLWDHLSISGFPTEGIWSFVAVSSVNPLGFPIFLLCFLIGINVSFKHPFLCTLFMGHLHLIQGFLFSPFTVGLLPTLRGSSASFLKSVPVGPLYYCTELALLIFWVSTVGKQNMTCNLKSYWMYVRIWGIVLMGFCSIV